MRDIPLILNSHGNAHVFRRYNANTDRYEDLLNAGVIDPAKVTRIALQNAVSIAGLLLTTDCLVTEKPKEKEEMPPGGPGGPGGYGGGMDMM